MTTAYARCSACSAALGADADWCPQCFTSVRAAPAPAEPEPVSLDVPLPAATSPGATEPAAARSATPASAAPDDALAALRVLEAQDPVNLLGSRLVEPRVKLGAVLGGGLGLAALLVLALTLLGALVA
ncbi:hypothetical protein [Motilibacter deserti]|uniref:Zinc ribbon domain-containing protein n=1 Tax=Motilibacter deserti TaxID=2714956 RepID=A0ABX0GNT4_9ACTN|nr:hypothetical protein [Motilibacter deserti]NHC12382.1 hypothetical protein [Motilibacter deserti]